MQVKDITHLRYMYGIRLHFVSAYSGKTIVKKYGYGSCISDKTAKKLDEIRDLEVVSIKPRVEVVSINKDMTSSYLEVSVSGYMKDGKLY